jgi:RNA polymerase sigma factor (sigma-70 family)
MSALPVRLNACMDDNPAGNSEWFRTVVGKYEGALVRYAARITRDLEQARDVVQDAFLRLHREFGSVERSESAAGQNHVSENGRAHKTLSPGGRGQGEGDAASNGTPSPSPRPSPIEGEGEKGRPTQGAKNRPDNVQAWLYTVCRRRALDLLRKENRMKTLADGQAAVCECPMPSQGAALEQAETENQLLALVNQLPENQQEVVRLKFQDDLSYRDIAEVTGLSVSNVGFLLHVAVKRLREQMAVSG